MVAAEELHVFTKASECVSIDRANRVTNGNTIVSAGQIKVCFLALFASTSVAGGWPQKRRPASVEYGAERARTQEPLTK